MKRLSIHLILSFLFGFFIIYFLYAGLPYDFNADILRDEKLTSSVSYSQLFSYIVNPSTPAWFFYPRMEELRPFMYVIHKFFLETFPGNLLPVHLIVALAHGLLAAAFFLIFYWITENSLCSWLLIFLYASFPTNGVMLAGYVSLEIQFLLSALELGGIAALTILTARPPRTVLKKAFLILGWLAATWIAIKWKSSEKILPFVYLAFLIFRFNFIRQHVGARLLTLIALTNLFMFVLAVPLKTPTLHSGQSVSAPSERERTVFTQKEKQMTRFHFPTLLARTFLPQDEKNPLFTVSLDKFPTSFTGNLGFFLGWVFWVGLFTVAVLHFRTRPDHFSEPLKLRLHALTLILFWFLAVVAGFGAGKLTAEVRYLNYAYVPGVILIGFLLRIFQEFFFRTPRAGKVSVLVFSGMVLFTLIQNYGFLTKWVGFYGGIQHANYESDKLMYESVFHSKPKGFDVLRKHGELEDRALFVTWYDAKPDWFEKVKAKFEREQFLFVKSRGEPDEKLDRFRQEGYKAEPAATFSFYDAKPLFFRFSKFLIQSHLKKSKNLRVELYKVS